MIIIEYFHMAFGMKKSTLLIASKFLDIQTVMNHIFRNVTIPMFGFIRNLLRFLGMWDNNIWFISRNLKWINYFSYSIIDLNVKYQVL